MTISNLRVQLHLRGKDEAGDESKTKYKNLSGTLLEISKTISAPCSMSPYGCKWRGLWKEGKENLQAMLHSKGLALIRKRGSSGEIMAL